MAFQIELAKDLPDDVDIVLVPACSDQLGGGAANGDTGGAVADWAYLRARGFDGNVDQIFTVPGRRPGSVVMVVGLGPSGDVTPAAIRRASAVATRSATRHAVVATHLLDAVAGVGHPDRAGPVRPGPRRGIRDRRLPVHDLQVGQRPVGVRSPGRGRRAGARQVADALVVGERIGEAVTYARDLVNTPGGTLTPAALAECRGRARRARGPADHRPRRGRDRRGRPRRAPRRQPRLDPAASLHRAQLRARQAPWLAGRWSARASRSTPAACRSRPADGMMTMKSDMGGAAAVLGAFVGHRRRRARRCGSPATSPSPTT